MHRSLIDIFLLNNENTISVKNVQLNSLFQLELFPNNKFVIKKKTKIYQLFIFELYLPTPLSSGKSCRFGWLVACKNWI